jgi:hypothetical protein
MKFYIYIYIWLNEPEEEINDILIKEIQRKREFLKEDKEFQGGEFLRKHISVKI